MQLHFWPGCGDEPGTAGWEESLHLRLWHPVPKGHRTVLEGDKLVLLGEGAKKSYCL